MPGRLAETAKMVAELDLKTGKFTKGVSTAVGSLGKLTGSVAKSRAVAVGLGVGLERAAEVGIRAFAGAVGDGLQSLADVESASVSVSAAISQVGLAGQVTAAQVADWSVQIETAVGSAFDDKAINASAETLIRYGKVTSDNLEPALVVMTDLAAKTGDVESAASLLAKALADPEKAAGKLSRQGVILTKTQQDQIKAFVKAGKTAQAQKVIIDSLSKTTAGAAKASAGPYQQSINQLRDAYEEATKALAIGFLPLITKVRDILTSELAKPSTIQNIKNFGSALASGLGNLIDIARGLPWGAIASSLQIAGTAAKTILDAFLGLPTWVQTAVITGWGLNKLSGGLITDLASGLIKGVLGMTAGVVNINAGVVNGAGGLPVGQAVGAGAATAAGGLGLGTVVIGAASAAIIGGLIAEAVVQPFMSAADHAAIEAGRSMGNRDPRRFDPKTGQVIQNYLPKVAANTAKALEPSNFVGSDRTLQPTPTKPGTPSAFSGSDWKLLGQSVQEKLAPKITELQQAVGKGAAETDQGLTDVNRATIAAAQAATNAGLKTSTAAYQSGLGIQAAIRASQPITNVDVRVSATTVQKSVNVVTRYGPIGGDRYVNVSRPANRGPQE